MILKNKLTKETLDIPYVEFRKKFAKEIQDAFESYRKTQLNKYSWNFKDDNSLLIKTMYLKIFSIQMKIFVMVQQLHPYLLMVLP